LTTRCTKPSLRRLCAADAGAARHLFITGAGQLALGIAASANRALPPKCQVCDIIPRGSR
jgi:hypothetical protein